MFSKLLNKYFEGGRRNWGGIFAIQDDEILQCSV